tara:strand:- start:10100 stop:12085 length:1986 start_codon:yes stop_codon:yes gene_type:complete
MPSSISFRGRNIYLPSVVVDINNNLLASESLDAKNMCVIGHFPKLKPKTTYVFRNGSGPQVGEIYGNDYTMLLLNKIWQSPIFDSAASAASLTYVNAGSGSAASEFINGRHLDGANARIAETIVGANPGANESALKSIKLEALDYGQEGNDILFRNQVDALDPEGFHTLTSILNGEQKQNASGAPEQISVSSLAGKKFKLILEGGERYQRGVEVSQQESGLENDRHLKVELYDDAYDASGDGSYIFETQNPALNLAGDFDSDVTAIGTAKTTDTSAALGVLSFKLSDYSTYDAFTQAVGNAVLVVGAATYPVSDYFSLEGVNFDTSPSQLDAKYAEQDASSDAKILFTAHTHQLFKEINLLAAERFYPFEAKLIGYPIVLENQVEFRNLSGGSTVAPTDSDYETALEAVRTKDIQLISCLTDDIDVTQALSQHLTEVLAFSRDRQGFAAAPDGQDIDQAYALVVSQHYSKYMAVINQGVTLNDQNGDAQDLGPEYLAFLIMCMQGALPYAEPLSGKKPNIINTRENFDRELDVDKLIRKCQLGIYLAQDNELRIARGVSSWNRSNETIDCEMSARESILGAGRFLRSFLTARLGSKILTSTQGNLINLVNLRCKALKDEGIIKNFRNISIEIVDDTAFITLDLAVVKPLNFVRFTFNISDF